ncbi:hypothetical protein PCCS19_20870 [Paenibacillus sp. CCS19]|uniref:hypothetical protein n=1 Tax=Paenibacillus sp. CCS19 TaxID=3158387 RepID=UPI00256037D5|nr:hypothetical protein [Paenibacillus cellulosilyticus]GMK39033.1 hypothetical protein PCCS19_20870 [Paenibacillus cellulosilyticus]
MRKELQQQLFERFPWTRAPQEADNLWSRYGFDIGDGWYNLIHELFFDIEGVYHAKALEVSVDFAQIKQKFGALSIYTRNPLPEVSDLIVKYQERSIGTCEKCGDRGELRQQVGCWKVICDNCFNRITERTVN